MVFNFLDPIMSPLLALHPFLAIVLVAFLLSVMITYIYKWTTDQKKMKSMKDKMKKYQKLMKENRDKPEKMMKIQKKAMSYNMEYMKMSMKPTLFTFIPIIIIFGWLSANFAYIGISPGEEFTVNAYFDESFEGSAELSVVPQNQGLSLVSPAQKEVTENKVSWDISTDREGIYTLQFQAGDEKKEKEVMISEDNKYKEPEAKYKGNIIKKVEVELEEVKPMQDIPLLKDIFWIGNFGWLGTYILFSIIFSISIRKLLKIS